MPVSRPSEHPTWRRCLLAATLAGSLAACRQGDAPPDMPGDGSAPAEIAETPPPPRLDIPADAPKVVFLGDSLAAGLHLARHEAFPAVVQRKLFDAGHPFHLVNAGQSGDLTDGGLNRVDWLLRQSPAIVVVELGANDGLRSQPVEKIERNLRAIIERVREGGATPLLLGIRIPPNYGPEYTQAFDDLYDRIAEDTGVAYVPFFMQGVAGIPDMNLADGIHPTPEGHRRLAENIAPALTELLGR